MLDNLAIWDEFTIKVGPDISDTLDFIGKFSFSTPKRYIFLDMNRTWGVKPPLMRQTGMSQLIDGKLYGPSVHGVMDEDEPYLLYFGTIYIIHTGYQYIGNNFFDIFQQVMKYNPSPYYFRKLMVFFHELAEHHGWTPPEFTLVEDDLTTIPFDPDNDDLILDNRHLNIKDWVTQVIKHIKDNIPDWHRFFIGLTPFTFNNSKAELNGPNALFTTTYERGAKWSYNQFGHCVPYKMGRKTLSMHSFMLNKITRYPYKEGENFEGPSYSSTVQVKGTRIFISVPTGVAPTPLVYNVKTYIMVELNNGTTTAKTEINQTDFQDHSSEIQDAYNNNTFCQDNNLTCKVRLETDFDATIFKQFNSITSSWEQVPYKTYVYLVEYPEDNYNNHPTSTSPKAIITGVVEGFSSTGSGFHLFGGKYSFLPIPSEYDSTFQDALDDFNNNGHRTVTYLTNTQINGVDPYLQTQRQQSWLYGFRNIYFPMFYGTTPPNGIFQSPLLTYGDPTNSTDGYQTFYITQKTAYYLIPIKKETLRSYNGIKFKDNSDIKMKVRLRYILKQTTTPLTLDYAFTDDYSEYVENNIFFGNVIHKKMYGLITTEIPDSEYTLIHDFDDLTGNGSFSTLEKEITLNTNFNEENPDELFFLVIRLKFKIDVNRNNPDNASPIPNATSIKSYTDGVIFNDYRKTDVIPELAWSPYHPNYFNIGPLHFKLEGPLWGIGPSEGPSSSF